MSVRFGTRSSSEAPESPVGRAKSLAVLTTGGHLSTAPDSCFKKPPSSDQTKRSTSVRSTPESLSFKSSPPVSGASDEVIRQTAPESRLPDAPIIGDWFCASDEVIRRTAPESRLPDLPPVIRVPRQGHPSDGSGEPPSRLAHRRRLVLCLRRGYPSDGSGEPPSESPHRFGGSGPPVIIPWCQKESGSPGH